MFIFPRQNFKDHFIRDGSTGCVGVTHPLGWMTTENILVFIKYSAKHARHSTEKSVLLLLDNHHSHLGIETLNFAKASGIIMLSFPPHCSHTLQPLDHTVVGPFKKYVRMSQDNPGKTKAKSRFAWNSKGILAKSCASITKRFEVYGVSIKYQDIYCCQVWTITCYWPSAVENSEYDKEIPQSQTADKPMALWRRATQQ